ncbi:glucose-1-phosphate cytidylyltransferase [Prochlorococcus sp. AH-716-I07]|nr:glucose-1-phosphate cytidylyltransferase [Prochlorococcus sp. AH-716-I07]
MKVVILAGGYGTRLSEYTGVVPKPMVEIGDKPILIHIMNWYKSFGYNDFIVATGYKSEIINTYFENQIKSKDQEFNFLTGTQNQLSSIEEDFIVKTIYTGQNAMTGGRLLAVKKFIDEEEFMVTYGDGLSNINIPKLIEFHKSHKKIATISAVRPLARFGILNLNNNEVISFKEKQQIDTGWINGGFFVFKKSIFKYLDNFSTILEREPLEKLARDGELMAYRHSGFWQCMDTKRDKDYLQNLWESGSYPWISSKKD